MMVLVALLALAAAAPAATPRWRAIHSDAYGLSVPPGSFREIAFAAVVPPRVASPERPLTFSWSVIRPAPLPALVALEQCPQPGTCYPSVLRPNGQGSGTTRTVLRVTNRSVRPLDILFRYTVWEAW